MMSRDRLVSVLSLIVTVLLLGASSSVAASDWLQFRGPGGQGVSSEKGLPTTWGDRENLVWKTELPGYGASSPIIIGNKIYITGYSGYGQNRRNPGDMEDLRLHMVCLERGSGALVWDKEIMPRLPETTRVKDHGYAAATPISDGKHLFAFFGRSGVVALDLDGNVLWRTEVGGKTHSWGCGTSPILYENLVIVNASVESGSLVALDKRTGDEVWRAGGMNRSWNTPHLVELSNGKTELAVSVRGKVLGFDPSTGKQLWSCYGIQDYVCPSIVSQDGVLYAIGGRRSMCVAIRAGGRGDVTDSHLLWEKRAGANVSSPVIHGDYLYWVSDRNETAYCVRRSDGEVMFSQDVGVQPYASALAVDGKVIVVTRFDGTLVLAAKPKFEKLAINKFDDRTTFNASAVAHGGQLLLRSDKYLYCVGTE